MAAPSMKERQVCWGARDLYWRCLDDNAEDAARCKQLRSSFEASCPQQWVSPGRSASPRGRSGGTRSRRRARGVRHQLVVMAGESDSARPHSGEGTVL